MHSFAEYELLKKVCRFNRFLINKTISISEQVQRCLGGAMV